MSQDGICLLIDAEELFLSFEQFPWFRDASIAAITNVERLSQDHLHWPDLDVDLSVQSIRRPDEFPLVSKGGAAS